MNIVKKLFFKLFDFEPFRSELKLLTGAGIVIHQEKCGCVLKAEHQPENHLWIFQLAYSNCNQMKEAMSKYSILEHLERQE